MNKLIKTKVEYEDALKRIDALMDIDAPTSGQIDELELLAHLVEQYEEKEFPMDIPSPIAAIKFKMEQLNLKQGDLIPFIGSKSHVSEVLNGKRKLTLKMLRALHNGLGIPAKILLQGESEKFPDDYSTMEWEKFPLNELKKRMTFSPVSASKECAEEFIRYLIKIAGYCPNVATPCFRLGSYNGAKGDQYAILAWELVVRARARKKKMSVNFSFNNFSDDNLRRLANLSIHEEGPIMAANYLEQHGIILIVEKTFPKAKVDGVTLLLDETTPVIGLSLRQDRIDSFWFTLFHELAHLQKHVSTAQNKCIIDIDIDEDTTELMEQEANTIASNALIPKHIWDNDEAKLRGSRKAVINLARSLDIHPAIVAGRVRKYKNNYKIFHDLVGQGSVRKLFSVAQ